MRVPTHDTIFRMAVSQFRYDKEALMREFVTVDGAWLKLDHTVEITKHLRKSEGAARMLNGMNEWSQYRVVAVVNTQSLKATIPAIDQAVQRERSAIDRAAQRGTTCIPIRYIGTDCDCCVDESRHPWKMRLPAARALLDTGPNISCACYGVGG